MRTLGERSVFVEKEPQPRMTTKLFVTHLRRRSCVCCIWMGWSIEIQAVSNMILHSHAHIIRGRVRSASALGSGTLYNLRLSLSVCSAHSSTYRKMLWGLYNHNRNRGSTQTK